MQVTLHGVTDTITDAKYEAAVQNTAKVLEEALKIFEDIEKGDKSSWKVKDESKGHKAYNKRFPLGKVYHVPIDANVSVEAAFRDHWDKIEKTPEWNKQTAKVEKVATLTDHVDIIHYATEPISVLQGRDLVVCRMWRKIGDDYIIVGASFDTDIKPYDKKTRAHGNCIAGRVHPTGANKCHFDYLVSVELNEKAIPEHVLSNHVAELALKDALAGKVYYEATYGGH